MSDVTDARRRVLELPQKRLALLALQLQDELAREREARHEPIAVVGMGCRFPGGVESPDDYWRMLQEGRDAIVEVPADRWPIDELYDPDPDAPGRIATRWGGYLDDVQRFDAALFSISPREARAMDPQQRLVMEVTWRAFEDAGIPPDRYRDRRAGVFVGLCNNDYLTRLLKEGPDAIDAYLSSGNAYSVVSGRVSFTWGFRGPALTCDTACSSSLVALHGALRSLRDGESEMAVVAGVNVMSSPETAMALSRARMMAPDGRCKAFDDAADGFVRAEGCGVVLLKRLSDARRDGDRVHALLRGSAVGQDGRSTGLTVPNGPAQEQVVRAALADAQLEPDDIDYVEAHGTGTSLGDPIEIQALGRVFGRERARPLQVGSVKTNMGHLESAAGIAGVMKAVLSVREGRIPPHLHFETPSTRIDWDACDIEVPSDGMKWPDTKAPRRAGVSSFGFSGTNAHVVVEQAADDRVREPEASGSTLPLQLLPVSGFTDGARDTIADRYGAALDGVSEEGFRDFCHTARVGRSELGWRRAVVAADAGEVAAAFAGAPAAPRVIEGPRKVSGPSEVAFVFTGQGAQHPGMGRDLYDRVAPFREALDRCADILDGVLPLSLQDVLFTGEGDSAPIYRTTVAQPAVVAFEWSLAKMWAAWGVRPAAVVGHSLGEFAAACVAGVMSLEDTLHLVAERGRLLDTLPGGDRMAAIFAPAEVVAEVLAEIEGEVMIGAMNSPESTVISGRAGPVEEATTEFMARGVEARELKLDKGFHSSRVEPILDALEAYADAITFHPPTIPLARNVSGEVSAAAPSARYWREHAREPVKFLQGVRAVADLGIRHFLEVGPHPALSPMVAQSLEDQEPVTIPSLRRDGDAARDILEAAAALWVEGVPVALGETGGGRRLSIPGHPLEGARYWVDPPRPGRSAVAPAGSVPGVRLSSALSIHEALFTPHAPAFLVDHRFRGACVLPGPLYVEAAMEAARREGRSPRGVADLELRAPAVVTEAGLRVQTILEEERGALRFRILSHSDVGPEDGRPERWTEHARGVLIFGKELGDAGPDLPTGAFASTEPIERLDHLHRLEALGFELGSSAALWNGLSVGDGVAAAELDATLAPPTASDPVRRALLLDAAAQVLGAAVAGMAEVEPRMLAGIDEVVWVRGDETAVRCRAAVREVDAAGRVVGDAALLDDTDRVVAWLRGARLGPVAAGIPSEIGGRRSLHHQLEWRRTPLVAPSPAPFSESVLETTAAHVDEGWEQIAGQAGLPGYLAALPELTSRAAAYVARALVKLGLDVETGDALPDDLADVLGVHTRHRRLVPRLVEILVEAGYITGTPAEGHRVARALPTSPPAHSTEDPDDPVRAILDRCGRCLAEVLGGDLDPLEVLFPAGSRDTTRSVYRDTGFGRAFNRAVGAAVAASGADAASVDARPLRVLEVGGGSGSTTLAVLEALEARPLRYLFTDVGASLVAQAREELGGRPNMEFRTFDIETDPRTQGLEGGGYDLIVAANVVHATARLDRSLGHLHDLLAPGGILVLLEGTRPEPWVDITFGLTEGWWRFTDVERRDAYPLPPLPEWMHALADVGFESAVAVPSDTDVQAAGQAVILARKRSTAALHPLHPDEELALALGEAAASATGTPERILDARGRGPAEVISALRSAIEVTGNGRVWMVTAGAQAAPGDDMTAIDPDQAALWGLARCFGLEHPDRWGGILDVAPSASASEVARRVQDEIEAGTAEDQVVWRGDDRFVPRLASVAPPATGAPDLAPGSYLVTGGLGGLGPAVAEWLGARGATHLVLVGRSADRDSLDEAHREMVGRLEASGARVTIRPLDVTDADAVAALVEDLRTAGEPVRGVVHAAAVFDSAPVTETTPDRFEAVFGPKVSGARNLLDAVRDDELDFVVLFSSTTAILGVADLGAYAASNQAVDALAARARASGRPVTAIGWGIWDVMRLASDEERDMYARVGLRPMSTHAALEAMGRTLSTGTAHTVVADVDWARLRAVYESRRARPLLSELGGTIGVEAADGTDQIEPASTPSTPVTPDLGAMEPAERLERIAAAVETEVRAVLRLPGDQAIDRELGFFEMGMDSLMSVEIRGRLETSLGLRLPSTLAFNHPTVLEAADFIAGRVAAELPASEQPSSPAQPTGRTEAPSSASPEKLTEEELGHRLEERLAELEKSGGDR